VEAHVLQQKSGESGGTVRRRRRLGDRHGDSLDLAESVLHPRGSRAERDRYPRIRVDVVADEICERAVRESGRFKTVCHPNAFTERVDGYAGARPPADSRCIGASPPTARTAFIPLTGTERVRSVARER